MGGSMSDLQALPPFGKQRVGIISRKRKCKFPWFIDLAFLIFSKENLYVLDKPNLLTLVTFQIAVVCSPAKKMVHYPSKLRSPDRAVSRSGEAKLTTLLEYVMGKNSLEN